MRKDVPFQGTALESEPYVELCRTLLDDIKAAMRAAATPAGAAAFGLGERAVAAIGDPPMASDVFQTVLTGSGNLELDEDAAIDPSPAAANAKADAALR